MGYFVRDIYQPELRRAQLPRLRARRDGLATACPAVFEVTDRAWNGETLRHRRPPRPRRPRHGLHALRARLPGHGWRATCSPAATASSTATRPSSASWTPCSRQHAKWLKVCNQLPWRQRHRLPQLRPRLQRLAAGPQRLHAPGPRLPGPRRQQEGRRRAPLPAPRCQLPALLLRPLHPQPQLRERHRRLQAPAAPVAHHGAGRQALHPGHRHLAVGLHRRGRRSPTSSWPAAATRRRSRPWPPSPSCATPSRSSRSASSTSWTSCACRAQEQHPHGLSRRRSTTPSSRRTSPSSSPSTATRASSTS